MSHHDDYIGYSGALVGLLSAAEWPSNAVLPTTFDANERNLVSRLKVLAAVAETKQQQALNLAAELRRVRNEIRLQIEVARALESANAAKNLATDIIAGLIAITSPSLLATLGSPSLQLRRAISLPSHSLLCSTSTTTDLLARQVPSYL